jgi:hypothetical protein
MAKRKSHKKLWSTDRTVFVPLSGGKIIIDDDPKRGFATPCGIAGNREHIARRDVYRGAKIVRARMRCTIVMGGK